MEATADMVTTDGNVMDHNKGKGAELGTGPVFSGPKTTAAFFSSSGNGEAAAADHGQESPMPEQRFTEKEVEKDNLETGSPEEPKRGLSSKSKESQKPGKLGEMPDLIRKNTLTHLAKHHIVPISEQMQKNPFAGKRQLLITPTFNKLMAFDLSAKNVVFDKSPDFTADNIMPFHILALICLLTKEGTTGKRLSSSIHSIKEIKTHIKEECEDPDAIKQVTDHVFTEHAKTFHKTYHLLLQVRTDSSGNSEARDAIIDKWILKIKKNASTYFEVICAEARRYHMEQVLLLQTEDSDDSGDNLDT
jgi:hypothetical protein